MFFLTIQLLILFSFFNFAGNAVTLDFWTSDSSSPILNGENNNNIENENEGALTTILYAQVSQDDLPIHNANVEAFVYQEGGNGRPLKLKLEDNGRGYPDITMGDGIYSAYLTQQSTPQHQQKSYLSVVLKTDYNNGKFLFRRRTNKAG
jgi:hypothetical protein